MALAVRALLLDGGAGETDDDHNLYGGVLRLITICIVFTYSIDLFPG